MHSETVTIKKIVAGGFGLGHLPSTQVVMVQFGLPGESVILTTQEYKKNYLLGKVQQIENKHPSRITPPCQYYGICGGCNLQHCDYDAQINFKKKILIDLLMREKVLTQQEIDEKVTNVIGSPHPFHYRQRIRLQIEGDDKLGFNRFRSHEIVEIDQCLLAQPSINLALAALRETEGIHSLLDLSRELELQQNPVTDKISCLFHFSRKPRPTDIKTATKICADSKTIDRIFFTGDDFPIVGPVGCTNESTSNLLTLHYPEVNGLHVPLELSWEVGGFCQVNLEQNKTMLETVLQFCQVQTTDSVLDLYCGMGNFAIATGTLAKSVLGIEGQGSSIRCAKRNASLAHINNTNFIKQPVHKACDQLIKNGETFDCIIIDPPRQGAPELASQLSQLCTKRLVYISCDPATLCRDLNSLTRKGFSITKIQPIDMFPQTHHIETVVLLEK
ncbi:MAG: 23S rRNA (uracil1939-C5)-methyltransferase [Desulforhopalus sp.]|jgi:23S rRNA (uracil1939-C5)-methyltransferase